MDTETIEKILDVLGMPPVKIQEPYKVDRYVGSGDYRRFVVLTSPDKQVIRFYILELFNILSFLEYQEFKDSEDNPGLLINRDQLEGYLVNKILEK